MTSTSKDTETAQHEKPSGRIARAVNADTTSLPELDDFGLPIKRQTRTNGEAEQEIGGGPAVNGGAAATTEEAKSQSLKENAVNTVPGADKDPESPAAATSKDVEPGAVDSEHVQHPAEQEGAPLSKTISKDSAQGRTDSTLSGHRRQVSSSSAGTSEWSHQKIAQPAPVKEETEEDQWQVMPAYAPYDIYDDDNKLIAREAVESDNEADYEALGGAGKGYTRVQLDEDAQSATSLDEHTQYLFKDVNGTSAAGPDDDEARDALSQMQATKDLLTEGQRIAYVGMTRLALSDMLKDCEAMLNMTKGSKKEAALAAEAMKMWSQKMMIRLYSHMDINAAEQVMIEQLAEHGVRPDDLTPALMQNSRVKNPMAEKDAKTSRPGTSNGTGTASPASKESLDQDMDDEKAASPPPPYVEHEGDDLPEVRTPSQLPTSENIDIDLRWTVLCDLFLTLVADSIYDARSRVLLELVGGHMGVSWTEICRFEKRVTDALEMQQAAEKENWNEDEHKETRRKQALNKRYLYMGLATVGGSLVIGLSAGLLAPVIGAGLAAGFTTIGVAGTSGFLAGAGGAAIITSTAAASGGIIAVRAANRRTGAVKTFEYRPLHNNKRVNLIVTVSGWMTGKVDDVRLPYSTVDPVMGDMYSVLWEPEMLRSMGDTINILATEALTQGLQQVLGSTILISLMAALQLPVVLTKLAYLIDNPWTVSLDRANAAGLILADSLMARNLGTRPITMVGYSLGSRVIFSCLRELAKQGAYGIVQNVYLFGSPIVANKDEYLKARTVVAGRFVNGYARNDWILGYLFRLTSGGISRVAGLAPVEGIPRLENIDVTEHVPGHMSYRTAMPKLLQQVGFLVDSLEFTEIEDPDPENHAQRQRELINELEEARRELEEKEKAKGIKGAFGFFGKRKKAAVQKKEWETYQEMKDVPAPPKNDANPGDMTASPLFDIDAIRRELALESMEVRELPSTLPPIRLDEHIDVQPRELKSTLPPMKLNFSSAENSPRPSLHQAKTFDTAGRPGSSAGPGTPTPPPRMYSYDEDHHVQMTFDHDYDSPPKSSSSLHLQSPSPAIAMPSPTQHDRAATLQRPELKSSVTMPEMAVTMPALSALTLEAGAGELVHNEWADEDDEDEFREKEEVEMTFA